ncbi:protein of unknown function [Methylobacterium sp. 174MFSha1.1]|uniref:GIY-YIG nuclease family protein n=1 Tax=Methylobacterium sp. 174MFSha1.1 TaxID=1502749 RepID=UPI0008EFB1E0|nr:GIY-YIG nuclease family protein [Methylobacterium sp. 174MFSha1.1]SFU42832.1 protein of unknown function [Methylobacterium sp. 174MFSha1.1]
MGDDPDQPTRVRVYVGESDSFIDRIKSHAKDASKDFWSRVCVVTSKDANLTKSHVRYLEHRFVELTKGADRANLAIGNEPGRKALPESDISDMEFFIAQVEVILPVVGFDFLRPKGRVTAPATPSKEAEQASGSPLELVFASDKLGYKAMAVEVDGEVTVLEGSTATAKSDFASKGYSSLRDQLIAEGRLVLVPVSQLLRFRVAVTFTSASAAAAVVANRNTNERTAWRLVSTGQTLKEWQDAQLSIPS